MLFNSYIFLFAFLPLVLIGYYGLNYAKLYRAAQAYLIGMSLWFYGYNNIYYLAILVVSVLLNYCLAKGLFSLENRQQRRLLLWIGVLLNLGILFYFKYFDFFIENMNSLLKKDYTLLHVILPLGISFYTFQQLSFVIDCYKRECEEYTLLEYASYVTFFPQLIAGPIVFHDELIPQFRNPENRKGIYDNICSRRIEMIISDDYLKKYNMETLDEVKEMFGDTIETEINYYKTFLTQSDYVVIKIVEYFINGKTIEELRNKYSDLISIRQKCRDKINELQTQLGNDN